MDLKILATVFGVVFLAELGDKTQLATLLFASKSPDKLFAVFVGASAGSGWSSPQLAVIKNKQKILKKKRITESTSVPSLLFDVTFLEMV